MKLNIKYGIPFVELNLHHSGKTIRLSNVLIDTGSAASIISSETAIELGLEPGMDDRLFRVRGVGGTEFVYRKVVNTIMLEDTELSNFPVQVGAMDYGFEIDAIIGMDFLMASKMVVNIGKLLLYKDIE